MTDPVGPRPDPALTVDFTPAQLDALRAVCGLTAPGDREPQPDDLLAVLDAATIMSGALLRAAAEHADWGQQHD